MKKKVEKRRRMRTFVANASSNADFLYFPQKGCYNTRTNDKNSREAWQLEPIRVLLTDDNDEIRAALRENLNKQEDIQVIGEARNGLEALQMISDHTVDVMLLDMIMPQMDGYGVLEQMQKMNPSARPQVIVMTALGRDDFIARAIRLGVQYYMVKPVDLRVLVERIRDAARQMSAQYDDAPVVPVAANHTLDDRLSNIFLSLGIPAHIKGYQFLREAIKLVIEQPDRINRITKELYPAIARRFNTSSSKVERAIRHAIEVAWSRGRIDTLNRAFGCRVAIPEEKPTNGEFIALVADKLSMEHSA